MSEIPTETDDPCDEVNVNDLIGWTRYDSNGMCKKNTGQRLGRDSGDRYSNSWTRYDRC